METLIKKMGLVRASELQLLRSTRRRRQPRYPMPAMLRLLGVSVSGYYGVAQKSAVVVSTTGNTPRSRSFGEA